MAVVLSLVIIGWLFAIVVGSRFGFNSATVKTPVTVQSQAAVKTSEETSSYTTPASAV